MGNGRGGLDVGLFPGRRFQMHGARLGFGRGRRGVRLGRGGLGGFATGVKQ